MALAQQKATAILSEAKISTVRAVPIASASFEGDSGANIH